MSVPAEVERKVRQLDNDVSAIYGMLRDISKTLQRHGKRLDDVDRGVTKVAAVQMRHGNRLDELDGRLADLDSTLNGVVVTQQRHGNRFDELDGKLDTILDLLRDGRPGSER